MSGSVSGVGADTSTAASHTKIHTTLCPSEEAGGVVVVVEVMEAHVAILTPCNESRMSAAWPGHL